MNNFPGPDAVASPGPDAVTSPGPDAVTPPPDTVAPPVGLPDPSAVLPDPQPGSPGSRPDPLEPWADQVTWRKVSSRLVALKVSHLAATVAVLVIAALVAWAWVGGVALPVLAAALVVAGALRAVLVVRSVRSWRYAERERDLLVRHGLLVRRLSIVPYARMQFVDVTAGPLERVLKLATVAMHTAAATSDVRIPGLLSDEATRLRDRLARLGEAHREDR